MALRSALCSGSQYVPMIPSPQKLPALTGLRFFACAMILGHHARGSFGLPVFHGWLLEQGVSLFFVLSGFVLVYSYPELPSWHSKRAFLIARFARLWPAYIVSIAVVAIASPQSFFIDNVAWHAVTNALMIQTWPVASWLMQSFNGPSWSISTEFGFYVLFLWLIVDFERTWWWKLILALAAAVAAILLVNYFGDRFVAFLNVSPLARAFEFVSGMCAALLWKRLPRCENRVLATALEITAVLLFALTSIWAGIIWQHSPWLQTRGATAWFGSGGSCAMAAAILVFVLATGRGAVSWFLSRWPVMILGEASYSIYLLHLTVFYLVKNHVEGNVPDPVALGIFLTVTIGSAIVIWHTIEKTARRWLVAHLGKANWISARDQQRVISSQARA